MVNVRGIGGRLSRVRRALGTQSLRSKRGRWECTPWCGRLERL